MKRAIWLILFAVLVFAGFIIARLPASWVVPARSDFACADVDGTIWSGTCTGLTVQRQSIGDLSWELHASRLLAGKLNAAVVLTRPTGGVSGTLEVGFSGKDITARDIKADLPLDPTLMPQVPANLHGTIHADLTLLRLEGGVIKSVQGSIEAHDLVQGLGAAADRFGSYSLTFPAAGSGDPVGQLRDLGGGPLAVEGTLRLTPEPGIDLEALVKALPTAPADMAQEIQFLGSPDAQGRRPFSFAATF